MINNVYDVGVIGCGIAGAFAIHKMSKENKELKIIGIELGSPPAKRRRQIESWFGVFPNTDGKLYLTDQDKVANIIGARKTKSNFKSVINIINNVFDYKTIKDKSPSINTGKRIKKAGFDIQLNDYIQMYPKEIHALSKFMADEIELNKNISFSFDNEVCGIIKQKNTFIITTKEQEFKCKKILISVGRSGWRWAHQLYSKFGIIENNNIARYGIRIEMPAAYLKDFNKSNCTLLKNNELEIGPFSWNGTVIPEDHLDVAISAFRSNENRWETDKVSFSFIGNRFMEGCGVEQTDRISKLTFILANDRIIKEKISTFMNKKSTISIIPEYEWIQEDLKNLSSVIPDILTKAYFHAPTIMPLTSNINIGNNLSTEIEGMYVAGESAGVSGILSAAMMGSAAASELCK